MSGMTPWLWGPMAWRMIHGAAHRYDGLDTVGRDADIFLLVLMRLAWVLPCVHCRESYVRFLSKMGCENMRAWFAKKRVEYLVIKLHNLVNAKLGRPKFDAEIAKRRAAVWHSQFRPGEFIGLLFVIALNYVTCGEDHKQQRYTRFFEVLPDFALGLGEERLAGALEHVRLELKGLDRVTFEETFQETLLEALHHAYELWMGKRAPELSVLVERYGMCRAGK